MSIVCLGNEGPGANLLAASLSSCFAYGKLLVAAADKPIARKKNFFLQ